MPLHIKNQIVVLDSEGDETEIGVGTDYLWIEGSRIGSGVNIPLADAREFADVLKTFVDREVANMIHQAESV